MTLREAAWQHRAPDIDTQDPAPYDLGNVLHERTPVVSRHLQVYTWGMVAISCLACGFFITGWKEVLIVLAVAVVFGGLFAWIGIRRGR